MRASFLLPAVLATLPLFACGTSTYDGPYLGDAGPLVLQAFGGTSGEVAAQVPLDEPGVGQAQTCTASLDAGACSFTFCKLGGIGSPGGGYGNFGPISASVGATTVPIPYKENGYPTVDFPSSVALTTGETMTFRGGGVDGVPAFEVTATIPGLGVITSPVPATDGGAATVDTSSDLTITWMPIATGQIHFELSSGPSLDDDVTATLACTFDGSSGSGKVSRTLLSSLKEKSGALTTYGGMSSELDVSTVVNGLTIVTQSYQLSPSTRHDFEVTLE